MEYKEIEKANSTILTTDIKGKDYAEVNQRIKAFRMVVPNGSIITEIISLENGVCVMKAIVLDDSGKPLGVGHAYEKEGSTFINKTSYIENCETSAVGRALGMCGFGIETSVASYEEVANAIEQQQITPKTPQRAYDNSEKEKHTVAVVEGTRKLNIRANQEASGCPTSVIENFMKAVSKNKFDDLTEQEYNDLFNLVRRWKP